MQLKDYAYPVYGVPSAETNEAIRLAARLEGMMTDPVYEGKSMQGLIDLVRKAGSSTLTWVACPLSTPTATLPQRLKQGWNNLDVGCFSENAATPAVA